MSVLVRLEDWQSGVFSFVAHDREGGKLDTCPVDGALDFQISFGLMN